jgi:hypothetical protein
MWDEGATQSAPCHVLLWLTSKAVYLETKGRYSPQQKIKKIGSWGCNSCVPEYHVLLGHFSASVCNQTPSVSRECGVFIFKVHFDPRRWDHHVLSKHSLLPTNWATCSRVIGSKNTTGNIKPPNRYNAPTTHAL